MRKQYLHLSAYRCDICGGPVVAGWLGVRENAISRETDIRQLGATCISCGHRQDHATEPDRVRHVMPMEWEPAHAIEPRNLASAYAEALNRAEVH
jgi:DNA-directed RNA polymerase subunit RPC12/RpoP